MLFGDPVPYLRRGAKDGTVSDPHAGAGVGTESHEPCPSAAPSVVCGALSDATSVLAAAVSNAVIPSDIARYVAATFLPLLVSALQPPLSGEQQRQQQGQQEGDKSFSPPRLSESEADHAARLALGAFETLRLFGRQDVVLATTHTNDLRHVTTVLFDRPSSLYAPAVLKLLPEAGVDVRTIGNLTVLPSPMLQRAEARSRSVSPAAGGAVAAVREAATAQLPLAAEPGAPGRMQTADESLGGAPLSGTVRHRVVNDATATVAAGKSTLEHKSASRPHGQDSRRQSSDSQKPLRRRMSRSFVLLPPVLRELSSFVTLTSLSLSATGKGRQRVGLGQLFAAVAPLPTLQRLAVSDFRYDYTDPRRVVVEPPSLHTLQVLSVAIPTRLSIVVAALYHSNLRRLVVERVTASVLPDLGEGDMDTDGSSSVMPLVPTPPPSRAADVSHRSPSRRVDQDAAFQAVDQDAAMKATEQGQQQRLEEQQVKKEQPREAAAMRKLISYVRRGGGFAKEAKRLSLTDLSSRCPSSLRSAASRRMSSSSSKSTVLLSSPSDAAASTRAATESKSSRTSSSRLAVSQLSDLSAAGARKGKQATRNAAHSPLLIPGVPMVETRHPSPAVSERERSPMLPTLVNGRTVSALVLPREDGSPGEQMRDHYRHRTSDHEMTDLALTQPHSGPPDSASVPMLVVDAPPAIQVDGPMLSHADGEGGKEKDAHRSQGGADDDRNAEKAPQQAPQQTEGHRDDEALSGVPRTWSGWSAAPRADSSVGGFGARVSFKGMHGLAGHLDASSSDLFGPRVASDGGTFDGSTRRPSLDTAAGRSLNSRAAMQHRSTPTSGATLKSDGIDSGVGSTVSLSATRRPQLPRDQHHDVTRCSHLTELVVSEWDDECDAELLSLLPWPQSTLRSLEIRHAAGTQVIDVLAKAGALATVGTLSLVDCQHPSTYDALRSVDSLPLRKLSLARIQTKEVFEAAAPLLQRSVTTLRLSDLAVDDAAIAWLLDQCAHVEHLTIDGCPSFSRALRIMARAVCEAAGPDSTAALHRAMIPFRGGSNATRQVMFRAWRIRDALKTAMRVVKARAGASGEPQQSVQAAVLSSPEEHAAPSSGLVLPALQTLHLSHLVINATAAAVLSPILPPLQGLYLEAVQGTNPSANAVITRAFSQTGSVPQ